LPDSSSGARVPRTTRRRPHRPRQRAARRSPRRPKSRRRSRRRRRAKANSTGTVGPRLDGIDLSKDEIAQQVRDGGGGMPAFGDRLSDAEIDAVADYVENG
jgi:hypothetical protein